MAGHASPFQASIVGAKVDHRADATLVHAQVLDKFKGSAVKDTEQVISLNWNLSSKRELRISDGAAVPPKNCAELWASDKLLAH